MGNAIWYVSLIDCTARAKRISSRGKRNPSVVKRRTSYYPSRKGNEPLNVRLRTKVSVKNTPN